ncbi:glycosyltransferase family 2 protein [Actinacidiphila acididurans]|uniref:Glycosyltransferase family 2 protein n=1 Tax=Actinacidiphila acididurans TaxID=2784346 RepID=A0ABS2TY13_9ACTN|nr:glycosyltransferase family A protein [Actinacidiphila acididurans]MBM9508243.1 glycosyltransferase family 2 protein [Actinacidiphila acididurans]
MTDDLAPVSVVIAAYNAEKTLGAAVASALGQGVRPAQVIVVDDGSQDGTASVAASFPEVLLVKQDNQGPSAARNTGIANVTQPWVAFLDADDVWLPDKMTRQLAASARHPSAVLLAGDWVRTFDESRAAESTTRTAATGETLMGYGDVLVLNRFQTSTVLVRTEVLRTCGGFDPALDGAEDWDMWLRCAAQGDIVKLDTPLVIYRDEPTGYSKNLVRLYDRMLVMLDRERRDTPLSKAAFARVLTWHHLRFAVAFAQARQPDQARRAVRELRSAGLTRYVPAATVTYLAPFLGGRVVRRLRRPRGI